MSRQLKTSVLDQAARYYAALFVEDRHSGEIVQRTKFTTGRKVGEPLTVERFSRAWVILQFYNFTYKDEFDYMVQATRQHLGPAPLAAFDDEIAKLEPRSEAMFQQMLRETGKA